MNTHPTAIYTRSDVEKYIEENKIESTQRFLASASVPEPFKHSKLIQKNWHVSEWLSHILTIEGADIETAQLILMVLGQRSLFGDAVEWALIYANEFVEYGYVADQPGEVLADKISAEAFAGLTYEEAMEKLIRTIQ